MDGAAYRMTRLDYLSDEITEARARELFELATQRESAQLKGDLERGFDFYAVESAEGLGMVRCRVEPIMQSITDAQQ